MSRFVGWDQRRYAAPADHGMYNANNDYEIAGPALEASLSPLLRAAATIAVHCRSCCG